MLWEIGAACKRYLIRVIDWFIPVEIFDFFHEEEQWKARSVVFVIFINLMMTLVGYLLYILTSFLPDNLQQPANIAFLIFIVGYSITLVAFRLSLPYTYVSILYAATSYVALSCVLSASELDQYFVISELYLLIPIFAFVISGFVQACGWALLVYFTPLLFFASSIEEGQDSSVLKVGFINTFFIYTGMLLAFYVVESYRKQITARLNIERMEFEFAAAHDALTGLANRATFDKRLQECLDSCHHSDSQMVLAVIDLDGFKPINDTIGHHAGDEVLQIIAKRLIHAVRATDTVARLGGDEFAIIIQQPNGMDRAATLLHRVLESIASPIHFESQRLAVTGSIGAVVYPDHCQDCENLKRKADEAMYRAKGDHNQVVFYGDWSEA